MTLSHRRHFLHLPAVLRRLVCSGLMLLAGACAATAQVQTPIRFVVGAAAGGSIDVYGRIVGAHMAQTLGRPIINEFKAGANGNIAAEFVADATADGGTAWVGAQSMLETNPTTYRDLRWKVTDFIPIIKGIETPLVLVVHPSVPAKTFDEFIAWAKNNRGQLTYANYGPGTLSHFLGYEVSERYGLNFTQISYRGNAPQMVDLIAGHALFGFTQLQGAVEPIHGGLLRALISSGEKRSALLPEVPTFADIGKPDLVALAWFGLLLKSGTPPDIVNRFEAAAIAAHADPDVRAKLVAQGFDISGQTGQAFRDDIAVQTERWAKVVKASGFTAE
jgi:tripartite-type tricarboxylate transporter receptor subunit TctC